MGFKISIRPIVFSDAEEVVKYYDKRLAGLGKRFYNAFVASIAEIEVKPFVHS
jgi:hypothetical protein